MHTRLRLLQGATALLYFGPLLAGLGGFGWAVVPLFTAIFMGWLFILRPQQWPRSLSEWGRPEALISLLTQGVVQVLLVAVSFGIGRGIGGVLGTVPPFPLMLPVGVSFLSIPLARMIWDPWKGDRMGTFLDDAIAQVDALAATPKATPEDLRLRVVAAKRMVGAMGNLPADTAPEVLSSHLMAMSAQVNHDALRVALMDPVYDGSASDLHLRAAVVHSTTGAAVDALAGSTYPLALFHELTTPEPLQLFAGRCAALVAENPDRADECPSTSDVLALAGRVPQAAMALTLLADALTKADPGHG